MPGAQLRPRILARISDRCRALEPGTVRSSAARATAAAHFTAHTSTCRGLYAPGRGKLNLDTVVAERAPRKATGGSAQRPSRSGSSPDSGTGDSRQNFFQRGSWNRARCAAGKATAAAARCSDTVCAAYRARISAEDPEAEPDRHRTELHSSAAGTVHGAPCKHVLTENRPKTARKRPILSRKTHLELTNAILSTWPPLYRSQKKTPFFRPEYATGRAHSFTAAAQLHMYPLTARRPDRPRCAAGKATAAAAHAAQISGADRSRCPARIQLGRRQRRAVLIRY